MARSKKLNRQQMIEKVGEILKALNGNKFDRELAVEWVKYVQNVLGFKRNKDVEIDTIAVFETVEGKTHYTLHIGKDAMGLLLFSMGKQMATEELVATVEKLTIAPIVKTVTPVMVENSPATPVKQFKIKVKQWLTRKEENPIPMRTMVGEVLRETSKAIQVKLHGFVEATSNCNHCGRDISHPVSMLIGLGPVCGQHFYDNPLNSEEELQKHYNAICEKLHNVTWEGWIPKSQIVDRCEYLQ